jgi:NitT/TauT family transport system substrate-binding protein
MGWSVACASGCALGRWNSESRGSPATRARRIPRRGALWIPAAAALATLILLLHAGCGRSGAGDAVVRIGYFPNITHAQAVIGMARGTFQEAVGPGIALKPMIFNAGPSAIEALFAGEIDMTYIGPNPAINGHVRSNGRALRIIAGATSGGAVLVVRPQANIRTVADLAGKRIASPQLGNTQDVALRYYVKEQKLKRVKIIPIQNPDILTAFLQGEIDGAWVPEPWGARLIAEGEGQLLLDERERWPNGKFVTAHLIVSCSFLEKHGDLVKKVLAAHVELTRWINANLADAKKALNGEIERIVGKALPLEVIDDAFTRLEVTCDPVKSSLMTSARWAFELGFLGGQEPDLSQIYDLRLLNEVLVEKGLSPVP